MHVAVVHSSSSLYGSDRMLEATVRALVPRGVRISALVPAPGPLVARLEEAGARVHVGGVVVARRGRGIADLKQFAAVPAAVRLLAAADLVHANTSATLTPLLLTGRRPLIYSVREKFTARPVERALATAIARRADIVLGPSSGTIRDFLRAAHRPVEARVVGDALGPEPPEIDYEPPGRPAICCVGRFNQWKGQCDLIRAFARIAARHPGASLVLVGAALPGQERFESDARSLVDALGLAGRVDFVGEVDSGEAVMRRCDIVAVPSSRETFGLVILEAMRSRRPVVTSTTDGAREIVTPGRDGLMFDIGDVDGLAAHLLGLIEGERQARAIVDAAAERVTAFSIERLADETLAVYEFVLTGRARKYPTP